MDAVQAQQALIDKTTDWTGGLPLSGKRRLTARTVSYWENQCDYAGLTEAEQAVFRVGQEVFAIMTRIRELEDGIPGKDGSDSGTAPGKDKKNNVNSKFTGYLKQMGQEQRGAL